MSSNGSVSDWIEELRSQDSALRNEAAELIWKRYSLKLLELARNHLNQRIRQREDEEDVVQSMYASFCQRHRRGDFTLDDRGDLWNLLVTMTLNKARKTATRHRRGVRAVDREQAGSSNDDSHPQGKPLDQVSASGPSPVEAVQVTEMLERLLESLGDSQLQEIVLLKLEGHTNEEIAEKRNCAVRTVERKVSLVRQKWQEIDD